MAKLAQGIADDVVTTLSLAFKGPQILAPAMNPEMWHKPSTLRNQRQLADDGFAILNPRRVHGQGDVGVGRLPEESVLLEALVAQRT